MNRDKKSEGDFQRNSKDRKIEFQNNLNPSKLSVEQTSIINEIENDYRQGATFFEESPYEIFTINPPIGLKLPLKSNQYIVKQYEKFDFPEDV